MPSWRFASLEREPFARTGTRSERVRGLAAHGLKGLYQHRRQFVANTRWWPPFCLTIDWVAATIIIIEIGAGGHHHAKYNHRDQDTGPDASALTVSDATFVFADIAGFTALTEAHGDEQAATLVADFCDAVRAELPAGASHVKTIGDALMLRVPDPGQAVLLGLHIAHGVMRAHGAPAVRVGLHHGAAVERDGDYFGAAVNLAARVSGLASGGEVLLTGHTAALAPQLGGVFYEHRGREALRNVREPVEIFAAIRQGESRRGDLPVDPVCRMVVDPDRAAGRLVHEGSAYFFCTLACAGEFAREPDRFVA